MQTAKTLLSILVFFALATPVFGQSFFDQFKDPKDGAFDTSHWLLESKGFLPVPIIITEPAVGYGGGAALLFFHKTKENEEEQQKESEDEMLRLPPSISGVAGAYTENDSWFAGAGHFGSWRRDTIRYVGALGAASLNLKFYGARDLPVLGQRGLDFNIKGQYLLQELTFRISNTKLFLGGRYDFLSSEIGFDISDIFPRIPPLQFDSNDASLSLIANYDARDNIFTPNSGHHGKLEVALHDNAFGGDFDYNKTKAQIFSWWGILPKVVLGTRFDYRFANGDVPFYAYPYIDLEGIPVLRYQGDDVFVAELRPRWDFRYRWSLVGFIGAGWAADSVSNFDNADAKVAGGLGIRYFLARHLGLRVGVDVARGPDETAFYIVVGNAWR
jgi:hypothetical protein